MAVELITGVAGCGKTTELVNRMLALIDDGLSPFEIGFISLTRAAAIEAATRAADVLPNCSSEELAKHGWFRTIHSACYKAMGISGARVVDQKWMAKRLSDGPQFERVISMWDICRARLDPSGFEEIWDRARRIDGASTPSIQWCTSQIKNYEQAKREDNRLDFADMLLRYAGFSVDPSKGVSEKHPEGIEPDEVMVWFVDEAQDNSPLSNKACQRLAYNADQVILVGDPQQAIYGFQGANAEVFQQWDGISQRTSLHRSFRCPRSIVDEGEWFLDFMPGYEKREIECREGGAVERLEEFDTSWLTDIRESLSDPQDEQTWLLLSRDWWSVSMLEKELKRACVPYSKRGDGGSIWQAPKQRTLYNAFRALQAGHPIEGWEFRKIVEGMPAKFFQRGTKAKFKRDEYPENWSGQGLFDLALIVEKMPVSDEFEGLVSSGDWMGYVKRSNEFERAVELYGEHCLENIRVECSTIHSAKGSEADNVVYSMAVSNKTVYSMSTFPDVYDAEFRLAYVAVTRAKNKLTIINNSRSIMEARQYDPGNETEEQSHRRIEEAEIIGA